jgi:hypothetical protein
MGGSGLMIRPRIRWGFEARSVVQLRHRRDAVLALSIRARYSTDDSTMMLPQHLRGASRRCQQASESGGYRRAAHGSIDIAELLRACF